MGLDISLYKCADLAKANKAEKAYETESDKIWSKYPEYGLCTLQQRAEARKEIEKAAIKLGLDKYGCSKDKKQIEIDSKSFPQHMFKIGYFRSSYNDGGINSVLGRLGIPSLADIFSYNETYPFIPDWQDSKSRCEKAIKGLEKIISSEKGKYTVSTIDNYGSSAKSPADALEVFLGQRNAKHSFSSYACKEGTFFHKGTTVFAVIPGERCIYLIESSKDTSGESCYTWYLIALNIVLETIQYVLNQPDKENYYLSWSG